MKSGSTPQTATFAPVEEAALDEAERLSAWFDGELESARAEPVLAGLVREPALQQRYRGWCMVSDALRSEEVLAGHSPRLCARIAQALEQEPALLAPAALPAPAPLRRHLASAFAVAAAAVVLVLVAVPQLRGSGAGGADAPALISSAPLAPTARADTASAAAGRNPRLDPYLQAHRDFMGSGVMPAAAVYLRSGNEGER